MREFRTEFTGDTSKLRVAVRAARKLVTDLGRSVDGVKGRVGKLGDAIGKQGQSSRTAAEGAKRQAGALRLLVAQLDPAARQTQLVANAEKLLNRAFAEGQISIKRHADLMSLAKRRAEQLRRAQDGSTKAAKAAAVATRREATALRTLVSRLDPAARRSRQLADAQRILDRALRSGAISSRRYADLMERARRPTDSLRSAQERATRSSAALSNGFVRLARRALLVAAAYVGVRQAVQSLREVTAVGLQLERINSGLEAATGSSEQARAEFKFLREETDRLGIQFESAAISFSQLAASAKNTALQGDPVREIFSSISEAGVRLRLTNEQLQGTFVALQQIISKNRVSTEELRRQLGDRLFGSFQAAARAVNVTTEELDALLVSGSLVAETFLPAFAREIRNTFGLTEDRANSAFASFNRLQNAIFESRSAIAAEFLPALGNLADSLSVVLSESRDTAEVLGGLLADGVGLVSTSVQQLAPHLDGLTRVLRGVADLGDSAGKGLENAAVGSQALFDIAGQLPGPLGQAVSLLERLSEVDLAALLSGVPAVGGLAASLTDLANLGEGARITNLVDQLTVLRSAADQLNGDGPHRLDAAIENLQKRIASLKQDAAAVELIDDFDFRALTTEAARLGRELEDLQFQKLLDGLAGATKFSDRFRISMEGVGGAISLINKEIGSLDTAGLSKAQIRAKKFREAIELLTKKQIELNRATKQALSGSNEQSQSQQKLERVSNALSEALSRQAEFYASLREENEELAAALRDSQSAIEAVDRAYAALAANGLTQAERAVEAWKQSIERLLQDERDLEALLARGVLTISQTAEARNQLKEITRGAATATNGLAAAERELDKERSKRSAARAQNLADLRASTDGLIAEAAATRVGETALRDYRIERQAITAGAAAFDKAIDNGAAFAEAAGEAVRAADAIRDLAAARREAAQRLIDEDALVEQAEVAFDRVAGVLDDTIGVALDELLDTGKIEDFWGIFENAGKNVIRDLAQELIKALSQKIILNLIARSSGGGGGGGFGSLVQSAAVSALKQYFGAGSGGGLFAGILGGGGQTAASLASGAPSGGGGGIFSNAFSNINWSAAGGLFAAAAVVAIINELDSRWRASQASRNFTNLNVGFVDEPNRPARFVGQAPNEFLSGLSDSREFTDAVVSEVEAIIAAMGGVVESFAGFQVRLRADGKEFQVIVGDTEKSFKEFADAVNFGIVEALGQSELSGLGPNMQKLLDGLSGSLRSVEELANEAIPLAALLDGLEGKITVNPFDVIFKAIETDGFKLLELADKWGLDLAGVATKIQRDLDATRASITDQISQLSGGGEFSAQAQVFRDLRQQAELFNEAAISSNERLTTFGDAVDVLGDAAGDAENPITTLREDVNRFGDTSEDVKGALDDTISSFDGIGKKQSRFGGLLGILEHELEDVALATELIDLSTIEAAASLFNKRTLASLIGDYGRLVGDQESIAQAQRLSAEIELLTLRTRIANARLELDLTIAQAAALDRVASRIDQILESGNIPISGGGGGFRRPSGGGDGGTARREARRNELRREFADLGQQMATGIAAFSATVRDEVAEVTAELQSLSVFSADFIAEFARRLVAVREAEFLAPFLEQIRQEGEAELETRARLNEARFAQLIAEAEANGFSTEAIQSLIQARQLERDAIESTAAEIEAQRQRNATALVREAAVFRGDLTATSQAFAEVENQAQALIDRAQELGIEIGNLGELTQRAAEDISLGLLGQIQQLAERSGVAAPELEALNAVLFEREILELRLAIAQAATNEVMLQTLESMGLTVDGLLQLTDQIREGGLAALVAADNFDSAAGSLNRPRGTTDTGRNPLDIIAEQERVLQEILDQIGDIRDAWADELLSPLDRALAQLTRQGEELSQALIDAGASAAQVAELEAALSDRRAELIRRDNARINDLLQGPIDRLTAGLQSPQQNFQSQFEEFQRLEQLALAGDRSAREEIARLGGGLIDASESFFGDGAGGTAFANDLRARLLALRLPDGEDGLLTATEQQTDVLRDIRALLGGAEDPTFGGTVIDARDRFGNQPQDIAQLLGPPIAELAGQVEGLPVAIGEAIRSLSSAAEDQQQMLRALDPRRTQAALLEADTVATRPRPTGLQANIQQPTLVRIDTSSPLVVETRMGNEDRAAKQREIRAHLEQREAMLKRAERMEQEARSLRQLVEEGAPAFGGVGK